MPSTIVGTKNTEVKRENIPVFLGLIVSWGTSIPFAVLFQATVAFEEAGLPYVNQTWEYMS